MKNLCLSALAAVGFMAGVQAAPEADKVSSLPNMTLSTNYYAGYVDIPNTSKKLHYIFVESQNDPTKDPVILWTNGGPGCASLGAFLQEHGPWVVDDGQTEFHENEYSWNKEASVIYVDQPAGVGYSYCDNTITPEQCNFDDMTSSEDNLQFIMGWFSKFPEYKTNDFYISGESYGGIYVPYMLYQVDKHNNDPATKDEDKIKNMKGIMVGNGVTNWNYDTQPATLNMTYEHLMIPEDLWEQMQVCNYNETPFGKSAGAACDSYLGNFSTYIEKINLYNVYGTCWGLVSEEEEKKPNHLYSHNTTHDFAILSFDEEEEH